MTASRIGTIAAVFILHAITLDLELTRSSPAQKKSTGAAPPQMLGVSGLTRVVLLRDGRLMGAYTIEETPAIAARYSTDNGRTWSQPETLIKLPKKGTWAGPEVMVDDRGEVHLFFLDVARDLPEQGPKRNMKGRPSL